MWRRRLSGVLQGGVKGKHRCSSTKFWMRTAIKDNCLRNVNRICRHPMSDSCRAFLQGEISDARYQKRRRATFHKPFSHKIEIRGSRHDILNCPRFSTYGGESCFQLTCVLILYYKRLMWINILDVQIFILRNIDRNVETFTNTPRYRCGKLIKSKKIFNYGIVKKQKTSSREMRQSNRKRERREKRQFP